MSDFEHKLDSFEDLKDLKDLNLKKSVKEGELSPSNSDKKKFVKLMGEFDSERITNLRSKEKLSSEESQEMELLTEQSEEIQSLLDKHEPKQDMNLNVQGNETISSLRKKALIEADNEIGKIPSQIVRGVGEQVQKVENYSKEKLEQTKIFLTGKYQVSRDNIKGFLERTKEKGKGFIEDFKDRSSKFKKRLPSLRTNVLEKGHGGFRANIVSPSEKYRKSFVGFSRLGDPSRNSGKIQIKEKDFKFNENSKKIYNETNLSQTKDYIGKLDNKKETFSSRIGELQKEIKKADTKKEKKKIQDRISVMQERSSILESRTLKLEQKIISYQERNKTKWEKLKLTSGRNWDSFKQWYQKPENKKAFYKRVAIGAGISLGLGAFGIGVGVIAGVAGAAGGFAGQGLGRGVYDKFLRRDFRNELVKLRKQGLQNEGVREKVVTKEGKDVEIIKIVTKAMQKD